MPDALRCYCGLPDEPVCRQCGESTCINHRVDGSEATDEFTEHFIDCGDVAQERETVMCIDCGSGAAA